MTSLPKPHQDWCQRTAQTHAACYALLTRVTIAAGVVAMVEIHKAKDVPALISLVVDRGPSRQIIPLHVEAAMLISRGLDQAVALVLAG